MHMYDLIEKKKRGGALSRAELDGLVAGAVSGDIPDYQLSAFLMAVYFQGMTAEETRKTGEMIKALLGEHTVIVVEHDMDFVKQVAQKVTVLHQGMVLAEGTFEEVESNPEVIQVYLKDA